MPIPIQPVATRFVIPGEVYWKNPDDTIRLVHLGALANALVSTVAVGSGSLARGIGQARDAVQAGLLVTSYLKEIIDEIDHWRPWQLIEIGVAHGVKLPKPVAVYRKVFSRGKDSAYHKFIKDTRNTKGFHVDRGHFEEWMNQLGSPHIVFWRQDGPSVVDFVFTASLQIQQLFGTAGNEADMHTLNDALQITKLIEAMGVGLVVDSKIDPNHCFSRMLLREVHIDYTFADGRAPKSEVVQLVVDESGSLALSINDLRDHVTKVLRGTYRAGAIWAGGDVDLSNDGGAAVARAGALAPPPKHKQDARFDKLRVSNMIDLGARRTDDMTALLTKVRQRVHTREEIDKALDDLAVDAAYWKERAAEQG